MGHWVRLVKYNSGAIVAGRVSVMKTRGKAWGKGLASVVLTASLSVSGVVAAGATEVASPSFSVQDNGVTAGYSVSVPLERFMSGEGLTPGYLDVPLSIQTPDGVTIDKVMVKTTNDLSTLDFVPYVDVASRDGVYSLRLPVPTNDTLWVDTYWKVQITGSDGSVHEEVFGPYFVEPFPTQASFYAGSVNRTASSIDVYVVFNRAPITRNPEHLAGRQLQVENITTGELKSLPAEYPRSFSFTGLEPNTEYDFRVRHVTNTSVGDWSSVESFRTLSENIQDLKAKGVDFESGSVEYDFTPDNYGSTYQWIIADSSATSVLRTEPANATGKGKITGLEPGTDYIFAAYSYFGSADQSTNDMVMVPFTTTVAAPLNVQSVVNGTQAVVSWDAIPGVTEYEVIRNGVKHQVSTIEEGGKVSFRDTGLEGDTTYVYEIAGITSAGYGDKQSITVVTSALAPSNVTATNITRTGATIAWGAVEGATGYTVTEEKTGLLKTVTDLTYTLEGLTEATEYKVVVAPEGLEGGLSSSAVFKTLAAPVVTPPVQNPPVLVPVDPPVVAAPAPAPTPVPVPTPVPLPTPAPVTPPVVDPVPSPTIEFTDIQNSFARESIVTAAREGIITGYPNGTFAPDKHITRAEFVALLVRASKADTWDDLTLPFVDTSSGSWYETYLKTALALGYVDGLSDTEFGPNMLVNREQATKMVVTALEGKQSGVSGSLNFNDTSLVATWAKDYVLKGVSTGVVEGYPDGSFKPKQNMTRAEAVTLALKLMQ